MEGDVNRMKVKEIIAEIEKLNKEISNLASIIKNDYAVVNRRQGINKPFNVLEYLDNKNKVLATKTLAEIHNLLLKQKNKLGDMEVITKMKVKEIIAEIEKLDEEIYNLSKLIIDNYGDVTRRCHINDPFRLSGDSDNNKIKRVAAKSLVIAHNELLKLKNELEDMEVVKDV